VSNVAKFPREKVYPHIVRAREMYKQPCPPDEMVWAICPWLRAHRDESRCHHCPKWEPDKQYGKLQRGCYAMAAEACQIVFAMQKRAKCPK